MEHIEEQIRALKPDEFSRRRDWLMELDWEQWDRQNEAHAAAGKLDALANEARADYAAGRTKPI